jgi:non-homologous end joining protein Ku
MLKETTLMKLANGVVFAALFGLVACGDAGDDSAYDETQAENDVLAQTAGARPELPEEIQDLIDKLRERLPKPGERPEVPKEIQDLIDRLKERLPKPGERPDVSAEIKDLIDKLRERLPKRPEAGARPELPEEVKELIEKLRERLPKRPTLPGADKGAAK